MFLKKFLILVLFGVMLTACGGATKAGGNATIAPVGDPAVGEKLFTLTTIDNTAPGCSTCHSIEPGTVLVGPSLAGVATRAGTQVKGQSAADYLRNSILTPNAYIVEGFSPDMMYQNFKNVLTNEQVNDLVAYLLTLK